MALVALVARPQAPPHPNGQELAVAVAELLDDVELLADEVSVGDDDALDVGVSVDAEELEAGTDVVVVWLAGDEVGGGAVVLLVGVGAALRLADVGELLDVVGADVLTCDASIDADVGLLGST